MVRQSHCLVCDCKIVEHSTSLGNNHVTVVITFPSRSNYCNGFHQKSVSTLTLQRYKNTYVSSTNSTSQASPSKCTVFQVWHFNLYKSPAWYQYMPQPAVSCGGVSVIMNTLQWQAILAIHINKMV